MIFTALDDTRESVILLAAASLAWAKQRTENWPRHGGVRKGSTTARCERPISASGAGAPGVSQTDGHCDNAASPRRGPSAPGGHGCGGSRPLLLVQGGHAAAGCCARACAPSTAVDDASFGFSASSALGLCLATRGCRKSVLSGRFKTLLGCLRQPAGKRAVTSAPCSGAESMVSVPSSSSARPAVRRGASQGLAGLAWQGTSVKLSDLVEMPRR